MAASSAPTIAIAFGGGGARGLAHIHVIEAMDELGLRPTLITGTSIGSIMGAGWAAGMSGREIRDFVLDTVGTPREVLNRLWSLRPSSLKDVMANGFRIGQFNLEKILHAFLPPGLPQTFEELKIPLGVTVTDYYGQQEMMVDQGPLVPALAASAALPAVFMPVRLGGRVMIDGGIFNPVPFDHLVGKADITVGIDVVGGPEGEDHQVPSRLDSLFGASQLMMQSIIRQKLKTTPPDIFMRPNVHRFKVLEFLRAAEVLEVSAGFKDDFKRALEAALESRLRQANSV